MPHLYRPYIPLSVRVAVSERQFPRRDFPESWKVYRSVAQNWSLARRLEFLMDNIARSVGCKKSDLRLDHDPALGVRQKVPDKKPGPKHRWFNSFGVPMRYEPDANDPDYLNYRPHGTEFEGSHDVKTRLRGDHGQHPDRVLIKKARRLERGPKPKRGPPIRSRGFAKVKQSFPKRRKK